MGILDAFADPQFRGDLRTGLFDLGKGASRAAGQSVTGLVDLITLGLRPFGYNVQAPIGSTAWAENRGAIPKANYTNQLAGLLGESVGGVAPMVVQAKAPQFAKGLLTLADNAMAPTPINAASRNQAGAIVWHGSPHKFDKFDASKIGTGEGAQAYGHGLYLAESPEVAAGYREALSKTPNISYVTKSGSEIVRGDKWHAADIANFMKERGIDPKTPEGSEWLSSEIGARYMGGSDVTRADVMKMFRSGVNKKSEMGALYKVDLPDTAIAKMLDWDKPLSQQQPGNQLALEALREQAAKSMPAIANGDPTARGIYVAAQAHRGGNQAAVSEQLRQWGVPGIRYLDGGSRGAGVGTSNYVIFPGNEDLLTILERNGIKP